MLVFELAKQVKRLELDFTLAATGLLKPWLPKWRLSVDQLHNLSVFKSCLCSLSLMYVNITTKDIDCLLLHFCMVLENLCKRSSRSLRRLRTFSLPLRTA